MANNLVIVFIAVSIVLSVSVVIISSTYDVMELPSASVSEVVSGTPVPTPDEISGLVLWLDADNSTSISIGVGVSQWDDQSGHGNHVVQATGTKQPTVSTSAINGKDAINFDGVDDSMRVALFSNGTVTQPFTTMVVAKGDPVSTANQYWFDGVDGPSTVVTKESTTNTYILTAPSNIISNDPISSDFVFLVAHWNGALSELFQDDTSIHTGDVGTNSLKGITLATHYNQASFPANVSFAEVLVYDGLLTENQTNDIVDYIETKYNLGMNITGDYSEDVSVEGSLGSRGWEDVQSSLNLQSQTGLTLLFVILVVIAAVAVLTIVRRIN